MNDNVKDPIQSGFREHTILIVDDNPANLAVLSDHLEDSGFRVLVAQDGESHWMEGVLLLAVYLILAIAFYFLP